jgi:predicted nucleotidyltransferase component of viral defense system
LDPRRESIIPVYREIPSFDIFIMPEEEILAEKIRAILTRQKPRDIYDARFLLIEKNIPLDMQLVNKKLSIYNLKFDLKEFENKIEKMKGLWQIDLRNLVLGELPDFEKTKKELLDRISKGLGE